MEQPQVLDPDNYLIYVYPAWNKNMHLIKITLLFFQSARQSFFLMGVMTWDVTSSGDAKLANNDCSMGSSATEKKKRIFICAVAWHRSLHQDSSMDNGHRRESRRTAVQGTETPSYTAGARELGEAVALGCPVRSRKTMAINICSPTTPYYSSWFS